MSSMMRKLSDNLSGAKKARQEKRMKHEMKKYLAELHANGNLKLQPPESRITLKMAEKEIPPAPDQPVDPAARAATEAVGQTNGQTNTQEKA